MHSATRSRGREELLPEELRTKARKGPTLRAFRRSTLAVVLGASLLVAGSAQANSNFEFFTAYGKAFKDRPIVATLMLPVMLLTTPFWLGGYLISLASGSDND